MSSDDGQRDVFIRGSGSLSPPIVRDTSAMIEALLARTPAEVGVEAREQYAVKAARVAEKTGIQARRFFPAERSLDDILAELAPRVAPPGFDWSRLDAILCASTSVGGFPGASQRALVRLRALFPALGDPFVLDLNSNACANFLYSMGIAASLIQARGYRNVLCLAVELASRCLTYDVREADTSMLFGDAAAGLMLSSEEGFARVLAPRMGSRVFAGSLELLAGGSVHPSLEAGETAVRPAWRIPGPETASRATALLVEEIAARRASGEQFEWLLPHQANDSLILAPMCARSGVPRDRLLLSLHEHGNTSSASMPLTFDLHRRAGRFSAGERVLMVGFGASLTVGSAIVEFEPPVGSRSVTAASGVESTAKEDLVAIVGMAARLPGAATVEEFWANLAAGRDCTQEVPADRWDVDQWYDPDPLAPNRTYCRRGGYVPDVHAFDARFFQVSPAEAVVLDPQHRLFYEVAYEALERAGHVGPGLARLRTGVYVGTSGQENAQIIAESGADITSSFVSGNTFSILANRLSYLLDLHGPSFAADTACSSALTVLHLARQAILAGEIDCALVGAVSLNLSPYKYISFAKAGMLAPDGRCKTFSAAADGYVPGEGVGAVVLRRLSDALRDGDTVLGVIRGSGVNQDGRSNGLTAPNPAAQRALYEEVYRRAGIDPSTISYVEAHGTGTALGDPIEVAALSAVFARHTARRQFCAIGSVKTNIGHLEPAAGVAGLIKLLLCLRHESLPPTLHLDVPSAHIGFVDTPFYPVVRATRWPRGATPRRATVSAMSFGGVNAHVVVEDPPRSPAPPAPPRTVEVVPLSGRTPRALREVVARLAARLAAGPELALADVALTLATGREHFERRHAVVAGSLAELRAQLTAPVDPATRVRQVQAVLSEETAGAAAALRGLVAREPAVAGLWREAGAPDGLDDAGALVLLQAGLLRLWTAWLGDRPPAAPEEVAAVRLARGAITAEEALRTSSGHARTGMSHGSGAMGHVPADSQVVLGVAGAGEQALAERLAALYRAGAAIDWLAVHAARRGRRIELPTYPYERQVYERPRPDRRRPKQTSGAGVAPVPAPMSAAEPPTEPALPLWEVTWTDRPAPASEPLAPRPWLVFEDGLGFAAALGERLAASGARVIRVRPGAGLDEVGPDRYVLRPTAPEEYVGLLAALQDQGVAPAIVHLWGCGPGGEALVDPAEARALELIHLLQALAQQGRRRERLPLCVVTTDVAPVGGPSRPEGSGVSGLLRTAAQELPQLAIRWVDVGGETAATTAAGQVLGELAGAVGDGLRVAAWRGDRRRAPALVAATASGSSPLRERGVYWITGGLGAVGRALALHLARRVRARLVLGGRTPLPERATWAERAADASDPAGRIVRDLLAIEAAGGEVLVTRADVAEALQVRAALREIEGRFGALHGVIHAAGVARDGLLRAKTPAQVHEVLRPKWTGARCLLTALGERPLDFVALMGSLAGVFGNVGQSDYALANSLLDGLAHARRAAERRVVALDWSLWSGEGMGAGLEETARARGAPPLAPARAAAAFEAALRVGAPQVVIAEFTGDPPALTADGAAERPAAGRAGSAVAVVEDRSGETEPVVEDPAQGVVVAVRGELVERWLLGLISRETDLPAEEIGVDTKFLELGVDSILAVKVMVAMEAALGEKLSRSLMFDYFTVERLAAHLVETYPGRLAAVPGLASATGANARGETQVRAPTVAAAPVASPVAAAADVTDLRRSGESWLRTRLAAVLVVPAEKIGVDKKFLDLGIDSILGVNLLIELEDDLGVKLSPSVIFDYFTIERLAGHLVECYPQAVAAAIRGGAGAPAPEDMSPGTGPDAPVREDSSRGAPGTDAEDTPQGAADPTAADDDTIAVIGIACRFPGADDPQTFWRNLCGGVDSVREAPADRIDRERWYSPDPRAPNKTYCTRGGWLDPIDRFDAAFFRLSPREADMMLPMQRMFLEVAWAALEDSGHAGARASGMVTGVYAGLVTVDSLEAQSEKLGFDCTPTAATGSAMSVVANRVSYLFDLTGPSMVLDTACSSALVATHLACQALRAGECELALVGGINLGITPGRLVAFAQAGFFAPDGRCKPFDDRGDGYVCGEGVAAVILKPRSRALADGDPIYAVIRGTAVNQDGLTSGLTAPNSRAQEKVLRAAYARARVDPASVGYVEAHGTGTALGDPIELRALSAVFAGQPRGACGLGSVKGNLGHLEGAAGLASLIKACLMLRHATMVPSLNFERPSRHVDLAHSPFFVVDRVRPWRRRGTSPRRAGVSSFGFGGTNAHAVLEEAPPVVTSEGPARERHALVLSAHTPSALTTLAARWRRLCEEPSAPSLASLCVSAATGRAARAHRLAIVAGSHAELAKKLAEETSWIRGEVDARRRPRVAFMCSGQGSQQPRMAEALYRGEPSFRAAIDRCAEVLRPHLEVPLLTLLYPPPGQERSLEQTQFTQPAVFAVDWSLAQMWIAWGVAPSAVIGHSLGEYVAACLAGVMTIEEALPLVAARARLMQALPTGGAMAAVMTAAGELAAALRGRGDVEIAAVNSPSSAVIAGDSAAVTEVCAALAGRGIRSVPLPVSHAFHSRRMEPMLAAFRARLREVKLRPPRLPIVSNLSGAPAGAEMADPEYWVRQVRSPVHFADGVVRLAADGATALLEVGPGNALTGLARECLRGRADQPAVLASLGRDSDDWTPVLTALSRLWTLGATIDWEATRAGQARVRVPTTPLERQRHGPVPAEPIGTRSAAPAEDPGARAEGARDAGGAAEMLAALHGGRISVREAMDALLRRRS